MTILESFSATFKKIPTVCLNISCRASNWNFLQVVFPFQSEQKVTKVFAKFFINIYFRNAIKAWTNGNNLKMGIELTLQYRMAIKKT